MIPAPPSPLDAPVQFLKGVGPRRAEALARLEVRTARELLFHVPRRYEDASTVTRIGAVAPGTDVTVIGTVFSKGVIPTRAGLRIFQAVLRDDSGSIECSWPGQPFLDRSIQKGDLLLVTGPARFFQHRQILPREHVVLARAGEETEAAGKVLPIYPATEGLSQKVLRGIVDANIDRLLPLLATEDPLPPPLLKALSLPTVMQAVQLLHRPGSLVDAERGRRRLSFDELFFLHLMYARAQQRSEQRRPGTAFHRTDRLIGPLYRALPFELTRAQTRAIASIFGDMTSPRRMNRLLQGDVGSGKTVVALFALALAVESGSQGALMAPTEILAEQHQRTIASFATPLGLQVVLLTGSLSAAGRRSALQQIEAGSAHIVIGTHALIQETVSFARLGLAVIDEQHRFGVKQRLALAAQGDAPDVLVMSATPIPRSLALTLYGDLDLTVLDELPPTRQPVRTAVRAERERDKVYEFVRDQVGEGRQAFIVYPLVAESEKVDLRAATAEYERLAGTVFKDLRVGLLHGQLGGEEKDAAMQRFAAGETQVLVATSVVEVGIDVPNATVMVVEHAERFGLSQLHQMRGRVGRGAERSYCILIAGAGETERLNVLRRSHDGFEIAREDLRLRGMGDFFGARQHGLPEFRFFDPVRDEDLLELARSAARRVVEQDQELRRPEHAGLAQALTRRFAARERLYDVG